MAMNLGTAGETVLLGTARVLDLSVECFSWMKRKHSQGISNNSSTWNTLVLTTCLIILYKKTKVFEL